MDSPPCRPPRSARDPTKSSATSPLRTAKTLQVVRCWSFQRPDRAGPAQQIEAWAWGIRALRVGGSKTIGEGQRDVRDVADELDLEAVFIPPPPDPAQSAFEVAMRAFGDTETNIIPVDFSDADRVAVRASQLLRAQ